MDIYSFLWGSSSTFHSKLKGLVFTCLSQLTGGENKKNETKKWNKNSETSGDCAQLQRAETQFRCWRMRRWVCKPVLVFIWTIIRWVLGNSCTPASGTGDIAGWVALIWGPLIRVWPAVNVSAICSFARLFFFFDFANVVLKAVYFGHFHIW